MSDSLQHHELQHARPPCPLPTPRVYSNSCSLSQWYCPTFSSSVAPFCCCLQSFPASGSYQMSQLFTSGGQSIGASASASVFLMNIQVISSRIDWFDLLAVQGTLKSLLQHHNSKASILQCTTFFMVQLSCLYMSTGCICWSQHNDTSETHSLLRVQMNQVSWAGERKMKWITG